MDYVQPHLIQQPPSANLSIQYQPLAALKANLRNSRTHSKRQIRLIADSIKQFGFTNPILVDSKNVIVAGHGRFQAAGLLQVDRVPIIRLEDLSPDEIRAYMIADNRLAEKAGWDDAILAIELQHLLTLDNLNVSLTGFEVPEIDLIIEGSSEHKSGTNEVIDLNTGPAVSRTGDVWTLGQHRLICGNSQQESTFTKLMGRRMADVVFTDPPYNVAIDGNVSGKGTIRHREFPMASGEMNQVEFEAFLSTTLELLGRFSKRGSIHFICMDWRHVGELLNAGKLCYSELLNLCVWVKNNGGMGSFYRSRHEMVFVFKNGKGAHRNNVQLGKYGRNRTNVWEYSGVSALANNTAENKLSTLHPTVKPIALVADALLDCSARGDLVLDSFLGSGTTLLAAERVGRYCYGIEIDPLYIDLSIRRWQDYTGNRAFHESGKSFDELATTAKRLDAGPKA